MGLSNAPKKPRWSINRVLVGSKLYQGVSECALWGWDKGTTWSTGTPFGTFCIRMPPRSFWSEIVGAGWCKTLDPTRPDPNQTLPALRRP